MGGEEVFPVLKNLGWLLSGGAFFFYLILFSAADILHSESKTIYNYCSRSIHIMKQQFSTERADGAARTSPGIETRL